MKNEKDPYLKIYVSSFSCFAQVQNSCKKIEKNKIQIRGRISRKTSLKKNEIYQLSFLPSSPVNDVITLTNDENNKILRKRGNAISLGKNISKATINLKADTIFL